MTIHVIFALLLLGHTLGDFYFQSDTMANQKDENPKYLYIHSGIYMLSMAAILATGMPFSQNLILVWLFAGLLHFIIDLLKKHIKTKPFIIDQALHILSLGIIWGIWGSGLQVRSFVLWEADCIPSRPLLIIILGLLWILRPIGMLIGKGEIWDLSKSGNAQTESQKGAGKMIGYLERIIVFLLLINGQYGSIAFVIAAKSVARFPEIKEGDVRSLAEYYLIGTLLSMLSVFVISILLGVINAP